MIAKHPRKGDPTQALELKHIMSDSDVLSEETSTLLDHSSAEWALYCLLTGHEQRAHDHLHRIRPGTKPRVLQAARDLVAILEQDPHATRQAR